MFRPQLAEKEKRWLFAYSLFLAALTTLPYVLAFLSQGDEWVFTGFLFGVEDGNSYIAKMLNGAQGAWLFRSPYSAADQQGALIYLPYLLLGKLFGPSASHDSLVGLYQLFRVGSIGALSFAVYSFLAHYIQDLSLRKMGLVLATLGGGLGWIVLAFGQSNWLGSFPLDFYSPESFGFLAIFGLPHLTLARALLFWGIVSYLRNDTIKTRYRSLGIAILWLVMALVHLLAAAIGLILLAAHLTLMALWRPKQRSSAKDRVSWQRHFTHALWAVGGAAFPLIYNAWVYLKDPYLQAWAAQNLITSPHPLHYLLAYGLLLPFIYFGARYLLIKNYWQAGFPVLWVALLPFMVYSPLGVQRRFAEGAWIAFLVLALAAFESKPFQNRQIWRWLFAALIPSTVILLIGGLQAAMNPHQPAFRPAQEIAAFEELRAKAREGDLAFSSFQTGNALPAWVPLRVLIGHGPESIGLATLAPRVTAFYTAGDSNDERFALLRELGADYVFWGPVERELGEGRIDEMEELELLIINGSYSIYRVIED